MKSFQMSVTEEMWDALEKERNKRLLDSVQELVRYILGESLKEAS